MALSKLKIVFFLTMSLMLLFAPSLLDISPDGKAYAMGFLGSKAGGGQSSSSRVASSSSASDNEEGSGESNSPIRVPEPATLLLVGAAMVSMAAFRKKFRKKP